MTDLRAVAKAKAKKYGLDPHIFERQINAESGFNPASGSSAGAIGVAQIMPATAKSWGVNPRDSVASLDAAAKHMAQYVKKFGSYENALRAYNAGEGAIQASHNYGETNAYVAKILNGRDPGKLGKPSSGAAAAAAAGTTTIKTPSTSRVEQTSSTSFDQAGYDKQAKLVALKGVLAGFNGGKPPGVFQSVLPDTADPAAFTSTKTGQKTITTPGKTVTIGGSKAASPAAAVSSGGGSGKIPGLKGTGSKLLELIHNDGGKGYGVKNGKAVDGPSFYSGVWAGHANHVHVGAGRKTVVGLGKLAQQMGLHVSENPSFGGVDPGVHVPGSLHDVGEAIDVSGSPAKMNAYARAVERIYGIKQKG